jgi:DNA-binding winged helix-turn-helix (wHTH) protein
VQPKVLDLLFCVVRARGRVVSRNELFEMVWAGIKVGEASLSRAVLEARRAIGDELQEGLRVTEPFGVDRDEAGAVRFAAHSG